ncbi:hypothetical protein EYZ11_003963 [Aspergillus tanneri]|uniref:GPI anchored cell wall protein n=1 Tax=Aspergillus tanneri TaxID=1220188 RepID=A0A4S3JSM7_9EURO|nr:uncharacterized protein ATNIH1004_010941 [Aspergillus tanneri]KAA8642002.1 hypothetical protein ATNIH1004_010941 [Aspergillus tanneri]THC96571.1 hypothetical protein EYZ11_003963 [Aspergillus tanneri]
MLSLFYSLVVVVLATSISAETTTIKAFNAGSTTLTLHSAQASIVNANSDATTYAMVCQSDAPYTVCALRSPVTITQGPSTYTMSAVYSTKTAGVKAKFTLVQDCDITSSTQGASCSVSLGMELTQRGISTSSATSAITSFSSDDIYYQPLTVTAGVSKLNAPQATKTPDVAPRHAVIGGAAAAAVAGAAFRFL